MKIGKLLSALRGPYFISIHSHSKYLGKPEDKKQQQEERAKMLKELELKLRIEQTELIANEFRRHSIYLMALVRFLSTLIEIRTHRIQVQSIEYERCFK